MTVVRQAFHCHIKGVDYMTNAKIKEVLNISCTADITEDLPWKIKSVCHKHSSHVFMCRNKTAYENYLMSEFSEEEIAEMTEEDKFNTFQQNWFAISFANEDINDFETEEYHGCIIMFSEDFINMQKMFKDEIDDSLLQAMIYNTIAHELGHIVHRTSDELVADRYSVKKTNTQAYIALIEYMIEYFKKRSHGNMKRYTEEYEHRNKILGL